MHIILLFFILMALSPRLAWLFGKVVAFVALAIIALLILAAWPR